MHYNLILTASVYLQLEEKKTFGLSKSHTMIAGELRSRDYDFSFNIRGAEADNAMNGAYKGAFNPPIILNDFLKSCPLSNIKHTDRGQATHNTNSKLTIPIYNVLHPQQLPQSAS